MRTGPGRASTRALNAASSAADAIGMIVEGAGLVVAMVRMLVRDLIAEFVSVLAVRLGEWLAEEAASFGIATPWVIAQVGTLVAKWAAKIARLLHGLAETFRRLAPLVRRLRELLEELFRPPKPNGKEPDYKIEGEYFDCYAPDSSNLDNVRDAISRKVKSGQADRIVLNLDDSPRSMDEIKDVLRRKPIADLKEIFVVKDGKVIPFYPFS